MRLISSEGIYGIAFWILLPYLRLCNWNISPKTKEFGAVSLTHSYSDLWKYRDHQHIDHLFFCFPLAISSICSDCHLQKIWFRGRSLRKLSLIFPSQTYFTLEKCGIWKQFRQRTRMKDERDTAVVEEFAFEGDREGRLPIPQEPKQWQSVSVRGEIIVIRGN